MYRPVSSHRGQPLYNIKIASELAGPKMSVIDFRSSTVSSYVPCYREICCVIGEERACICIVVIRPTILDTFAVAMCERSGMCA